MTRYAIVRNARSRREAEAYLPDNYRIVGGDRVELGNDHRPVFVIAGEDSHGRTLDGYVIPRYASGLIWAEEVDYPGEHDDCPVGVPHNHPGTP